MHVCVCSGARDASTPGHEGWAPLLSSEEHLVPLPWDIRSCPSCCRASKGCVRVVLGAWFSPLWLTTFLC